MDGYSAASYGDGFADVYDEWYHDVSDIASTIEVLARLAGSARVLELGVGTGRLAIPLARSGVEVHGIDTSTAMLDRLRRNDPDGLVTAHVGDMVDDLPDGPFGVVFVAYNTLFNLTARGRQRACFAAVAERLQPGGRFVVEAFVPDDPPAAGEQISVRSMTADRVVLSISIHDADEHTAHGQFVEISETGGVRLRPWMVRYTSVTGLDTMATDAGLDLAHRWYSFADHRFDDHSDRHVSVYRRR